jgi:environmental stress-induced protein Ves
MSAATVLRAADRRRLPWKNGGGITSDVVAYPAGATTDDFEWRVSIAEVDVAGPFSRFAGVDRTLWVLEGALARDFAGERHVLCQTDAALTFRGEATVSGAPLDGVARDLNVMTRRDRWRADVKRVTGAGMQHVGLSGIMLILATGPARVGVGQATYECGRLDALLVSSTEPQHVVIRTRHPLFLIEFERRGAGAGPLPMMTDQSGES